ncbi:rhodopsin, GQ-coupled-like [Mytilus californianus]|uniref:rhodopsin, GQ-coupled-like n=1 Tax=Mytilus californianus TaxID=6549 RepID=UPI002246C9AD|nr:rhodopsin, GQ-coupled-like [Mytilus californianus]
MSVFTSDLNHEVALTTSTYNDTTSVYDTYGYYIHPHWKQFDLVPDHWHFMVGVYITIVGLTGIIGNSIVIWIFSTTESLKTPSNMLITNLAVSDLIFSAVNGFPLLSISAFNRKWMWGDTACQFYGFIGGLFGLMSINTLAAISIDRYLNIAKPLSAAKNMTRRKALMMILCVWAWSLIWAVPPIFGWGAYIPEGFQTSCTFDYLSTEPHMRSYIFGLYLGGFVVPLAITVVCYVLILKAIRKHEREMEKVADKLKADDLRNKQNKASMEIKVARIAMIIVTLYILSWSPYATVALIGQFGPAEWVTPVVAEIPVMLAKACAMHNPIVYAFSHPKFRNALLKRVPWVTCCYDVKPSEITSKTNNPYSKRPLSRNMSDDSNYYGSEASSYVTSIGESIPNKNGRLNMQRSMSVESNIGSPEMIMELVRALVTVANRNVVPIHGTNPPVQSQDVFSVCDGKQAQLAKYLAELLTNRESKTEVSVDTKLPIITKTE